jgi:hypothetical protein
MYKVQTQGKRTNNIAYNQKWSSVYQSKKGNLNNWYRIFGGGEVTEVLFNAFCGPACHMYEYLGNLWIEVWAKKIDYLLAVEIETDQSINPGRVAIESVDGVRLKIRERNPPQRETIMNNNKKRITKEIQRKK